MTAKFRKTLELREYKSGKEKEMAYSARCYIKRKKSFEVSTIKEDHWCSARLDDQPSFVVCIGSARFLAVWVRVLGQALAGENEGRYFLQTFYFLHHCQHLFLKSNGLGHILLLW